MEPAPSPSGMAQRQIKINEEEKEIPASEAAVKKTLVKITIPVPKRFIILSLNMHERTEPLVIIMETMPA